MASPTDPSGGTPDQGGAHQPERPKRPDAGGSGGAEGGQRQPTRRMPSYERPDHNAPRQYAYPDPRRHLPTRKPNRPYWGPPIIPGVGASWDSAGSDGLPADRNVGRIRQVVLFVMLAVVAVSLVAFVIYYWAKGDDAGNQAGAPPAGATAQATDPAGRPDESGPAGDDALPTADIRASANMYYSQARAGQYELILNQSCDDVANEGTADNVAAMSDQYDNLLAWTIEDVQPADEAGTAVVTASLRFSGPGAEDGEETLLFIDEGGWRYCGSS